jgi:hypothetical protein
MTIETRFDIPLIAAMALKEKQIMKKLLLATHGKVFNIVEHMRLAEFRTRAPDA